MLDVCVCVAYCISFSFFIANNWGDCDNGTKAVGCGPQEIYRNCADISVLAGAGIRGSAAFNPRIRGPKSLKKYHPQKYPEKHHGHPNHRKRH